MRITKLITKKTKFQPIKTPYNLELEYYRYLKFIIEQIHKRFENIVVNGMNKQYIREQVEDESYITRFKRLINEFNEKIDKQFDLQRILKIAGDTVNFVYNYNETLWTAQLRNFGIDLKKDISYRFLKDYLKMRVQSNVLIITKLKDDVISSLEETIYRNFEQGKTHKELAQELNEKLRIDKRKAVLIARNEIKNTNTQLNKKRMQEYGIEKAIWETAEDERVRSDHRHFQGKEYVVGIGLKNSEGIYEEVGEAINCRCVAIPIL
jgi:SPP1 gp7 family putative phage head morphogenesis protein